MLHKLSRREFLRTTTLGTLGAAGILASNAFAPATAHADNLEVETDLVIAGEDVQDASGITSAETTADIAVDGYWGVGTTLALQAYFGITQTGYIYHQYGPNVSANPALTSGWYCDDTLLGDTLIRYIQQRLGTSIDGIFGTNDIIALQRRMGTTIDGVLSAGSTCVRVMQMRLNQGYF